MKQYLNPGSGQGYMLPVTRTATTVYFLKPHCIIRLVTQACITFELDGKEMKVILALVHPFRLRVIG